ncbi:MAG: hypothetical protein KIS83_09525 [Rubrivivax sp.]|nr:hypothetical protein [Rubrivivax sp.]MCW5610901.1 hypothetical protein [Rubrivivax sp.]
MKLRPVRVIAAAAAVCAMAAAGSAHAALTTFQSFVGNYGVSTDGWGSLSQQGSIQASVPAGATVVAAYLYTSTFNFGAPFSPGGSLNGSAVNYAANLGTIPAPACCNLTAYRADVTSIVKPVIDGGAGGIYNFGITETDARQDGSALVVVYQDASLAVSTVGILDGFSRVDGESTTINFAQPLDPSAAGFFAEMRLGIGFSCCDQRSRVEVNGALLTENAGNNDDATEALGNGNLITVGGFDDPFSNGASYANDRERYDLVPFINDGDTAINIRTINASRDDNIFLAVFHVAGEGTIDDGTVPEPLTGALVGTALLGLALQRRYAKKA